MSFRQLLTDFGVLALIGGLGCFLAPSKMLGSFGIVLPPMGLVIYQFWVIALGRLGALVWVLRDTQDRTMQSTLAALLGGVNALNGMVAVREQFAGASVWGWSMVALFSILGVAFGMLALRLLREGIQSD